MIWKTQVLGVGERVFWKVGPLSLWVHRTQTDWTIASSHSDEALDRESHVDRGWAEEPPEEASQLRCAAGASAGKLRIEPLLLERPVVIRPEQPLSVLPNDEMTVFVGSPLRIRLLSEEPEGTLATLQTVRLSDTWFGPSTRKGELCYASRLRPEMQLEQMHESPARTLTRVRLRNRGMDTLSLERFKVPLGSLALYRNQAGLHWTDGLSVVRDREGTNVEVRVQASAPKEAGSVTRVAEPHDSNENIFQRAVGALIG